MRDAPNAVNRELSSLTEKWNEFRTEDGRFLLVWMIADVDMELIEAFFAFQAEEVADSLDLFIPLESEFHDQEQYGLSLVQNLEDAYAEARGDLAELGVATDWQRPVRQRTWTAPQWFAAVCADFAQHYANEAQVEQASSVEQPIFVFVLRLQNMGDVAAWYDFLKVVAEAVIPANVRYLAILPRDSQSPHASLKNGDQKIAVRDPQLNMNGLVRELARSSGGSGPAFQFRVKLVDLAQLAAARDLSKESELTTFRSAAMSVLDLAKKNKWEQHQFAVHMLVANALIGTSRLKESREEYHAALNAAERAAIAGDTTARILKAQAMIGEATSHVAEASFDTAAKIYHSAAIAASEAEDEAKPYLEVEALRMEAFCCAKAGDRCRAWEVYYQALDVGERFRPDDRAGSSLPYVGKGLVELANSPRQNGLREMFSLQPSFKDRKPDLLKRMTALLGDDWQANLGV